MESMLLPSAASLENVYAAAPDRPADLSPLTSTCGFLERQTLSLLCLESWKQLETQGKHAAEIVSQPASWQPTYPTLVGTRACVWVRGRVGKPKVARTQLPQNNNGCLLACPLVGLGARSSNQGRLESERTRRRLEEGYVLRLDAV